MSHSWRALQKKMTCAISRKRSAISSTYISHSFAPTAEILNPYKKAKNGDWELYERQFLELIRG